MRAAIGAARPPSAATRRFGLDLPVARITGTATFRYRPLRGTWFPITLQYYFGARQSVRQVVLNTGPPEADEGRIVTAQATLISIVDDDDSMRSALVALICSLGHEACAFGSAEEFLDAGTARTASCIISDIQMPGMSGLDLQRRLAEQDVLTPMIMITAREEAGLKERALAGGALCFLNKPFDADILVECVERALKLSS